MIDKITTHSVDAKARLLNQYIDKLNILSLVEITAEMIQDAENYFYEMFNFLDIDTATGLWLDVLGEIENQPRNVFSIGVGETAFILDTSYLDSDSVLDGVNSILDDVQYRRYIKGKIFKNFVRNKNIDQIYAFVIDIIEPTTIHITEYEAKIVLVLELGGDTQKYRILNSMIAENPNWVGAPAGVAVEWSITDYK